MPTARDALKAPASKDTPNTVPKPETWKSEVTTGLGWEEFPIDSELDGSGMNKPARIPGCSGCTLFRSRRRGHLPEFKPPCICVRLNPFRLPLPLTPTRYTCGQATTKPIHCYKLHLQDIQGNAENTEGKSGFELYLDAIQTQLKNKAVVGLLKKAFFKGLPFGVHTWDMYLQILIEIVAKDVTQKNGASLQEGVWVRSIQVQPLNEKNTESSKVDPQKMRPLKEWKRRLKKTHTGYRGIGVAIDFRVRYPHGSAYSGVEMGIPLLKRDILHYKLHRESCKLNMGPLGSDPWVFLANSLSDVPPGLKYVPPTRIRTKTTSNQPLARG